MRLWITGVGVVSPLAANARETMDRLCLGHRAFGSVTLFDVTGLRTNLAAEIRDFRIRDVVPRTNDGRMWSRTDAFAIVAAEHALHEAKVSTKVQTVDLIAGTTTGATLETEQFLPDLLVDASADKLTPAIVNPLSLMVDNLRTVLGPFRRTRMVSSACSTGASALLLAGSWLRAGLSECVLVGASDALCRLTYCGFHSLGSLDPEPCRPFDRTRAGLSLGEAAAFFVVETEENARGRGVEPIVELAGWSALSEAHHITNPESTGRVAAQTMKGALACAGFEPGMVDYVNAHATATLLHDPMELRAMRTAFGAHYDNVLVSSTKGQLGHTLGAAGVLEVAVCAMAIAQSRVPPTAGLTEPADDCQGSHVIGSCAAKPIRVAMSNSFGFGGLDASIVVAHPDFRDSLGLRDGAVQSTNPLRHSAGFAHNTPANEPRAVWVHRGAAAQHDGIRTVPSTLSSTGVSDVSVATGRWSVCSEQGAVSAAVTDGLNAARTRRLQRAECLLTSVVDAALGGCDGASQEGDAPLQGRQIGFVAGRLSGNPDATSEFLDRIRKLGPRFASPADFPNLMLSSMAGHVAIYCKFHGISLSTSAMTRPGYSAIATAVELLQSGYPDRIVIGAVERWGMLARSQCQQMSLPGEMGAMGAAECERAEAIDSAVDTALGEASRNERSGHQADERRAWLRTEGAAAIVVDTEPNQAIARMTLFSPSDSKVDNVRTLEQAPIPAPISPNDCIIRVANTSCQWAAAGDWANAPIVDIEEFVGDNEASEVSALVMGAGFIDTGECERVLVVMQSDDGIVVACLEKP